MKTLFLNVLLLSCTVVLSPMVEAAARPAPARPTTAPLSPDALAAGDFDGDGAADLAVALFDADAVAILLNRPADRDGDGVPDGDDNCPDRANADQRDGDRDGTGDACDALDLYLGRSAAWREIEAMIADIQERLLLLVAADGRQEAHIEALERDLKLLRERLAEIEAIPSIRNQLKK